MTTLGKFELHEQLGRGAFGIVYRATDKILGREVALKVLHPQLMVDESFAERFTNEAQALAACDNDRIVTVYEIDEIDGRIIIAMRYLPGGNLKQLITENSPLPYIAGFNFLQQILEGLGEAHNNGLIHRDLKPENILLDAHGEAVITDFGLAKVMGSTQLSASTRIIGTPNYIAPEVWRGQSVSPGSDIYSLGCILYELLTGKVLFEGTAPGHVMTRHLMEPPKLPDYLPQPVKTMLDKALAKDPRERYRNTHEFSAAIDRILQSPANLGPVTPPPPPPDPSDVPAKKISYVPYLLIGGVLVVIIIIGLISGWFSPVGRIPVVEEKPETVVIDASSSTNGLASSISQIGTSEGVENSAPTDHVSTPTTEESFYPGQTMASPIDGMILVYVPAGEFMMGSSDSQGQDDEHPQHKVTLDAYWIDQTEVTNNMYALCVGTGRCTPPKNTGSFSRDEYYGHYAFANYPVINVEWEQAMAYCEWAGRKLPSEAQWEYAARGPQGFTYPWGNDFSCRYGNFDDEKKLDEDMVEGGKNCDGQPETAPVGSYREGISPFGVLDMAGNVWEWVADWYGVYTSKSVINPSGPKTGEFRVARGGSWNNSEGGLRSADRIREYPNTADYMLGFRCAVSSTDFP